MNEPKPIGLKRRDIVIAYTFLRLIVGVNFFNHGFTRMGSIPDFVASMVERFQGTFIPEILVVINAALVPPVELIVGVLITIGLVTRSALIACFCLMLVLMYGVTLLQDWGTAGGQLTYNIVLFLLLAGLGFNTFSVDYWLSKRKSSPTTSQTQGDNPVSFVVNRLFRKTRRRRSGRSLR